MFIACASIPPCGVVRADGVTDPTQILTPAPLPLQPVGTPFMDPVFDTSLRRVSNTSDSGGFETQTYSQLQAFSSDNAYILLSGSNGYVIRRLSDLSLVAGLDTSEWNAPRWHPVMSHTLVHFDSNADTTIRLQFTDVDTFTTTTVFTFPSQYNYILVNQSFDEISEDGRWLAGMVIRNDRKRVIFALDVQNGVLTVELPISDLYAGDCQPDPEWGEVEPDWVGVSPLGRYLVVQWKRDGITRCSGMETFDLQTGNFVGRVYDGHQHGDLGIDSDGTTEFFMTFEMSSTFDNNRPAIGMRELPGTPTVSQPSYLQVLDWGNAGHISCRGPNGVGLISCNGWNVNGWNPFERELFLQYTDGSVLRLAHHRSSSCGYWVQPRASISRDGRYIVFTSDWGQETGMNSCNVWNDPLGAGDPYIIDLGDNATGSTTTTTTTTTISTTTSSTITTTSTTTTTVVCQCPADSSKGCISGTVKNRTGNPLAKKTVRLKRISPKKPYAAMNVVTGNDGCYRFTNLKNGTYEIKVNSCNGGGTKTVDVTAGGKVNDVNFQCR